MAATAAGTGAQVKVTRWRGGRHPTLELLSRILRREGLRAYVWANMPNFRYPVRSHGYDKVLYCVRGTIELVFPEAKRRVTLHPGDRIDLPRNVRYGIIVGPTGAQCIEGTTG